MDGVPPIVLDERRASGLAASAPQLDVLQRASAVRASHAAHEVVEQAEGILITCAKNEFCLLAPDLPHLRSELIATRRRSAINRFRVGHPAVRLDDARHVQRLVEVTLRDVVVVHRRATLRGTLLRRAGRWCNDAVLSALLVGRWIAAMMRQGPPIFM